MATTWLLEGEVCIYTRGDSKNYYVGYRLLSGERKQESVKTRNKAVARERALKRYKEVKSREEHGLTQNTVSFAEAADAWLRDLQKQVAAGVRKERNIVDYAPIVERYLKPYFAGRNVDRITTPDIAKYRIWRRDYWISDPGLSIETIKYLRGGVEVTRPVSARDRKKVERPARLKKWWVKDNAGIIILRVLYGSRAIEVGQMDKLPTVLKTSKGAVLAGELDTEIGLIAKERVPKKKLKAA